MSLFAQVSMNVAVFGDSTKANARTQLQLDTDTLDNAFTVESSAVVQIPVNASDVAFGFQSVANGKLVVLRSDVPFTVKLGGVSSPALQLMPQINSTGSVTPAFLVMLASNITEIHLGNPTITPWPYPSAPANGTTPTFSPLATQGTATIEIGVAGT